MKKVFGIGLILVIVGILLVCGFNKHTNTTYLRVHIRANSNFEIDQNVKYEIKDEVVEYLTPFLTAGKTFEMAKNIINDQLKNIEIVANNVLLEKGFSYTAKAKLNEEFFPTRSYSSLTLESGFYDALIISLGSGEGDNWWCVVYPPLCFTTGENISVVYKSMIWEIIDGWIKNN